MLAAWPRSWAVSTFSVTPGSSLRSSPKRWGRSLSAQRISPFHLPLITSIAASIPQMYDPGRCAVRIVPPPDLVTGARVTTHLKVRT
jgi:hypothetical protein